MGPSVSFPIPPRIARKLPIRNLLGITNRKVTDTATDFYDFEFMREVLANIKLCFLVNINVFIFKSRQVIEHLFLVKLEVATKRFVLTTCVWQTVNKLSFFLDPVLRQILVDVQKTL